jgi:PAS domain S-box-containing protein
MFLIHEWGAIVTNRDDVNAAERRTADVLQKSDGAILWEADAAAVHFSFVSESSSAVLGCSSQDWRNEPGFLQKRVHPDDWSRLLQTIYEAAADDKLHKCEHRMLKADGSMLWAQTSVRPSHDESGATLLSGVTVDVSHVKELEERIRREETMSRRLVENIRGAALFMLSPGGLIETWTPEAKRLTGYCRTDIIGQEVTQLFCSKDGATEASNSLVRRAGEQRYASFEGWLARADGTPLWASLTVAAVTDAAGEAAGYAVLVTDFTERHALELELRRSGDNLRLLVQNVGNHGVWMTSSAGVIESWNRGAQRLVGYRSHEMVGERVSTLLPAEELHKGTLDALFEEAARAGSSQYEGWLVRKSGAMFWGRLCFGAAEDENEHLRGFATVARDLSDQKRKEDTLRANEEHFRLLVDSVQDYAIFMLSVDGRVTSWNRGAQRLNGYRSHEIVGSHAARFFPPDEVGKGAPARLIERAAVDGHASYEGWLVRRNGETFWGMIHLDAIEDENGQLRGFSNVARDLTAQKRTEAALRESEERLRLLVDSVQDYAVFMVSTDATIASWSKAAERLKGHRSSEAIGQPLSHFFPNEELATGKFERLLECARTQGRGEYEGWLVRKDGSRFWGNIVLSAVRDQDGQLRGFANVCRDLTERMRHERAQAFLAEAGQALAGSLDYRATLERVAQLAIRELADCCIVAIDTGAAIRPLAVAHVDLERQRSVEAALSRLPKDAPILHGIAETIATGESHVHADSTQTEWFVKALESEGDWARQLDVRSCMCVPMVARGQAFGAICFISSTPGTHYDDRDRSLAEELARRAGLATENARLYEEAQNAIRTREEVLAIVSHDLRGPLTAILLSARQSLESSAHDASVTAPLARIQRSAERMEHLIRDLLDFSSIEAGRLKLEIRDCDARELVREAIEMYKPMAAEKGVNLVDATGSLEARLRCDSSRVVQLFSNLLGNALKFTPAGATVRLEAALAAEERAIAFSVIDRGPGISDEDLPHIFDRYWHAKKRSGGGVGLGLAISKGLVEAHGGTIRVSTRRAEGSTFSFTLPIAGPGGGAQPMYGLTH